MIAHLLSLASLAYIALLPRIFFRRDGRFHAKWMTTAAPFVGAGVTLGLGLWGRVQPFIHVGGAAALALHLLSTASSLGAMALIRWTTKTHQAPLSLWHQRNDAPRGIVTDGPYSQVRHPFYSAFLLALLSALLAFPHPVTGVCLLLGWIALEWTARGEESRLLRSDFGATYRAYMSRTGRFFPQWGGAR